MSIAAEALAEAQAATPAPEVTTTPAGTEPAPEGGEPTQAPAAEGGKTLSWEQEVAKLPPELQNLAKGLQGMVTRKTQALAEERKQLAAEREAWRKSISKLATPATQGDLPDLDSWDPSSIQARIEAEVSRRLAEALAPVETEYRAAQADLEFDRFTASHPDLLDDPEVKAGVADLLNRNESLDLETAYFAVKGRLNRSRPAAPPAPTVDPRRAAARKAAEAVATPRRPPPAAPVKMAPADLKRATPEQILAYAKALAERR